jgi:hypothetical protein
MVSSFGAIISKRFFAITYHWRDMPQGSYYTKLHDTLTIYRCGHRDSASGVLLYTF